LKRQRKTFWSRYGFHSPETTGMDGFKQLEVPALQLEFAVQHGWAAVSTDGGHDADLRKLSDASWILPSSKERRSPHDSGPQRDIAWDLLHNFASRSLVDQIVVAKSIVRQFYGVDAHHSYWNGCSTGGRQGYRVAQKYPELLDGILANAPAISFVNLVMGELWPQQVMQKAKLFLSKCQLDYFRAKAIEHCELDERVKTGYVQDSVNCSWEPSQLVGSTFWCDESEVTVTQAMAEIVQAIQNGPGGSSVENRFPGLWAGVSMTALADSQIDKDGRRTPNPFRIAASWLQKVVLQDEAISETTFDENYVNSLWVSALYEFGGLLNTDDPDLSRLRDSGTKLLTWHGTDDKLIPFQNTVKYRRTVEAIMGGANEVDDYYRFFLAPGVDHCGGGAGPIPSDPLDALVRWVEDNEPPEILDAEMIDQEGDVVTRELCLWPATSKYMNIGDPKRASSWSCVGGTERPQRAEQEIETEFDYGSMQQPQQNIADDQTDSSKDRPGRAGQILAGLGGRLQGLDLGLRVE
ncbi:Tannase/feruloyl esterase, partial [Paraphoma chrysanthemicola]